MGVRRRILRWLPERAERLLEDALLVNSAWIVLNTGLTSGLGLVFWLVVSRAYAPDAVGVGAALVSSMTLLSLFARAGFDIGVIRILPERDGAGRRRVVNTGLTMGAGLAVAVGVAFILGAQWWSPRLAFLQDAWLLGAGFVAAVVAWTLLIFLDGVFIGLREARFVAIKNGLASAAKVPLPLVLAPLGAFGVLAAWGVGAVAALAVGLLLFLPRLLPDYRPRAGRDGDVVRELAVQGGANYLSQVAEYAPALLLPLLVVNVLGEAETAYFYVAWMIAGLLFILPRAVALSLFAEGSHEGDTFGEKTRRALAWTYAGLAPGLVAVIVLAPHLLALFGPSYPAEATGLLRVLAASVLVATPNLIYVTVLRVEDRLAGLVAVTALLTAGVLGFGVYFARWGVLGVGVGFAAAHLLVFLVVAARRGPAMVRWSLTRLRGSPGTGGAP